MRRENFLTHQLKVKTKMSNLFSPSAYKKAGLFTDRTNSPARVNGLPVQRKRRSSAMDMLFSAHTEARKEQAEQADAAFVRNMYHKDAKAHQRRAEERRMEEEKNEQYAQKVQLEEHDSALAERLHDIEHQKMKEDQKRRMEEEKLSEEVALKLQEEEEREAKLAAKQLKKIAAKDAKFAQKVHKKHVQDFKREENAKKKEEMQKITDEKKSVQMARNLQKKEKRELEREEKNKKKRAARDEKLAKTYHKKELSLIKKDEMIKQKKLLVQKREEEKKIKMNLKSQEIAKRLQEEEHREFMKEAERRRQQHEDDEKMARQIQGDELGDVAIKGSNVRNAWSNPKVEVEETKSSAIITVQLPNVRRMEVDLDEELNIIFISAKPKTADRVVAHITDDGAHDELKKIVQSEFIGELKEISFEIKLDDIIDGEVTADDILSEYKAETGLLRLELRGAIAKSKVEQKEFKKGLLSRLGRLFKPSFSGKSRKK
jgi:hypothetical protein